MWKEEMDTWERIWIRIQEARLYLHRIVYVENSREPVDKLLGLVSEFNKVFFI